MQTKFKILILLAMAVTLMGCEKVSTHEVMRENPIETITQDGCQYLVMQNGRPYNNNYSFALTHKGNCNNYIHVYR